jgi:RNA polymerase sigma factor (sigma-70 family)
MVGEASVEFGMTDQELLLAYQASRDKARFGDIVQRFVNLVYSVARRHVKDSHLAQDVAQEVFLAFYRAAPDMDAKLPLAGWFFTTTRQVSLQTLRKAARRRRREQEVAMSENTATPPDATWPLIAGELDEAVARLLPQERDVIVLRYFTGKSHQEIGEDLEISAEAASKRVQRALATLREIFTAKGVVVPEAALAAALMHAIAQPAPPALAATITHSAIAGVSGSFLKGALVASTKVKVAIVSAAAAVIFIPALVISMDMQSPKEPASPPPSPAPTVAEAPDPLQEFDRIYHVNADRAVAYMPPPFVASRAAGYREINQNRMRGQDGNGSTIPHAMIIHQNANGALQIRAATWGSGFSTATVIGQCMKVASQSIEGDAAIFAVVLPGDLIVRDGASQEQIAADLGAILSARTGKQVRMEFRNVDRSVYVLSGQWVYQALPQISPHTTTGNRPYVEIYGNQRNTEKPNMGHGADSAEGLAQEISTWIGKPVFIEAQGVPDLIDWEFENYTQWNPLSAAAAKNSKGVLDHVAQQTSLEWTQEERPVHVLFVEYAK